MRSQHLWWIALTFFAAGCGSDTGLNIKNLDPEALITSHIDGDEVVEGEQVTFVGQATDVDNIDVTAAWYNGGLELCEAITPDEFGLSICKGSVGAGDQIVTLEVRDPLNASARHSITVFGVANEAPVANLRSPSISGTYYANELVSFEATISDKEDVPEALSVIFQVNEVDLGPALTPLANGEVITSGTLDEGSHLVTVLATDSAGKVGTDTTTITVGPPNSPPVCAITSPTSGSSSQAGATVAFAGTATDPDIDSNFLAVEWSSDKVVTPIGSSIPNTNGDIAFLINSLPAEPQTITMTVTDEIGATCTDSIEFVVGTPPTIVLTSPVNGGEYIAGQALAFEGTVSDVEDLSTDLELDWSTDIDLSISAQGPDSSGFVSFSLDNLSVASHVLTVTATDTTGLIGQAQVSIKVVQNSLPTIGSVTISPDPVYVGDSLTCSYAGFSDADGHADSSTFQWKIDGTNSGSTNTLSGGFAKGEKVKCVVTPNDGIEDGTSVNTSVTVSNTLPMIGAVSISPANPVLDDTLTCNYIGFDDADGDSDSSGIEWFVGGTAVGAGSTLSGAFVGGDQVSCTVTPNDGEDDGMPLSATTNIENTAPSVGSVTLSPNPTMSTDLLTCSYSGYSDPDGDADASRYEWSVNGSVVSTGSTTLQSVFGRGDDVECAVIPSDGMDDGTPVSSSIVITNQTPEATVFLSPTAVATDGTVNAITTTNDVDGDSVTLSYTWSVNGISVGETGASLDGNTYFDRDDEVVVEVVPNDGADDGPAVTSGSITILNTAPSVLNAVISPAGPTAGDTLTCSYDFADVDIDADDSSIEWTVNSSVVVDPNGVAVRGDTVGCTVTADDGTDTGNTASTSVTIGNQVPTVSGVTISPSTAGGSDTLTCTYTYDDVDGDADNSTFLWQINGSNAGYTNTLAGGFARNDTVTCIVTPNDGTSAGASGQDQITIGNAAPVVTTVSITPDPAGMNDVLSCGYTTSDFDGDGVTVSYDWTVNGTSSGTAADLSGPFSRGDVIVCTVTPDDGTDVGNPLSDDATIGNTAPSILSVTITPDPAIASSILTCTYLFDDADGDGDGGSSISWSVDGTAAGTGSTLSGVFAAAESVSCEVTPDDGVDTGIPVSGSITINSPPTVSSASISPDPAIETDTLTCSYTFGDVDSDGDNSQLSWTVNGSPAGSGATLAPSAFATGDDLMCTVLANDGNQDGTSVSASIFVNGPPTVSSVTISPNPATASDSLDCNYNYIDTELDTDQSTITWTLNGVDVLTGSTLASGFVAGDEIGCRVNAADAYSAGNEETDTLTINTPPSVASATITPDPASVLDTLDCEYTFDDPDPLNLDQSTVEWIVNGVPSGTDTILTYAFVGGETVECTVTPFDGIEYGATVVQSASLRVNRVPEVSNVSVTPWVTFGDDDLTCTYHYTDADFDPDQSTLEWRVNGFAVGTAAVLPHYEVDEGDDVVCEVTPYDGIDYGVAVTDSVQVLYTEREWCGNITQDTVWEAHLPHRVTCDVKIEGASSPTLTVEDGAVILFDNYASIDIGYGDGGRLVVDGHTLGVTFTSSKTNPLPGDWEGIRFFSHDQFSSLTGLEIAYSGGSNTGSVYISSASPTLDGVTIRDGDDHGIEIIGNSAFPLIKNSRIEDNYDVGVYMSGTSRLNNTVSPSFTNNVITGNLGEAMVLSPEVVGQLSPTSSYAGNGAPILIKHQDKVESSATWYSLDEDLLSAENIKVEHASAPVLTLEDGLVLRFKAGLGMTIGKTYAGALVTNGSTLGITLTTESSSPGPADYWDGLELHAKDTGSILTGLTVEYGGYSSHTANIYIQNTSPTLDGVISRYSLDDGVRAYGANAAPIIQNSSLIDNEGSGFFSSSNGTLGGAAGVATFANNTVSGNADWAISLPASGVGRLDSSSTYLGNGDDIEIKGGDVEEDATWQLLDVDYFVSSTVKVEDVTGPTLMIEDGVTLLMGTTVEFSVGVSNDGRLLVDGHTLGVTMTSSAGLSTPGDWFGLKFGTGDLGSIVDGLDIGYAGKMANSGNIVLLGASPTFTNISSHDSYTAGLIGTSYGGICYPLIQDSEFRDNWGDGIFFHSGSGLSTTYTNSLGDPEPSFQNNVVSNNLESGVDVPARVIGQLDASSSIYSNGDGIKINHAEMDVSSTWIPFDDPYWAYVDLNVQGASNPTLTIEDGVTIEFSSAKGLAVGNTFNGRLVVDGHTEGVLFTSVSSMPAPGDWSGLEFKAKDLGSSLLGATVEYGGDGGWFSSGIFVENSSISLDQCTLRYNEGEGLYGGGGASMSIEDTYIHDNTEQGLNIDWSASILSFSGNTITENQTGVMTVNPESIDLIDETSVVSPNDDNVIYVRNGDIESDSTWRNLGPRYEIVSGDITVAGSGSPVLTIEDGVDVYWPSSSQLRVASNNPGQLLIRGDVSGVHDWDGQGYGSGVYFTSTASTPTAGDWEGIYIGSGDLGSEIIGLTLEYAGIFNGAGIDAYKASPHISHSSISDSAGSGIEAGHPGSESVEIHDTMIVNSAQTGVNLQQKDSGLLSGSSPSFTNNIVTGSGGAPIFLGADYVGQLDSTSSYTGNGERILINNGDVTTSATWQWLDEDYEVTSTIDVAGNSAPELIISDGVAVYFRAGQAMDVGNNSAGSLVVEGTSEGVLFTSAASIPDSGDWVGLKFYGIDQGSVLSRLDIEYAGGALSPAVRIQDASPILDGLHVSDSEAIGIYVMGASSAPTIENCTVERSGQEGLFIKAESSLSGSSMPVLLGNTFIDNGLAGISLPAHLAHEIAVNTTFAGNSPSILLSSGGAITESVTWMAQSVPYTVDIDVEIAGPQDPILTIKDGAILEFEAYHKIVVGSGTTGSGTLLVNGDVDGIHDWDSDGYGDGVLFTSSEVYPTSNDLWSGIHVNSRDAGTELTGLTMEYAGRTTDQGAIYANNGSPSLDSVTVQYSDTNGFKAAGTTPRDLIIRRSQFLDNLGSGLWLDSQCSLDVSAGPSFTDNLSSGNLGYAMRLHADDVGALDASSSFVGNTNPIRVSGDEIETDATWQNLDEDYLVVGVVDVHHPTDPLLTISDGVTIYMDYNALFRVGYASESGQIWVNGHTDGVLMTSDQASPIAGDVQGIVFHNADTGSYIDGLTLEYGARNSQGAITSYSALPTLTNSTITDSKNWGVYVYNSNQMTVSNMSYSNNTDGDIYMP